MFHFIGLIFIGLGLPSIAVAQMETNEEWLPIEEFCGTPTTVQLPLDEEGNPIEGKVAVRFDVTVEGQLTSIEVLYEDRTGLRAEALRIVHLMNNWPER